MSWNIWTGFFPNPFTDGKKDEKIEELRQEVKDLRAQLGSKDGQILTSNNSAK